ncbi:unnamed protein product [Amoebophrya sp. A120]|nr:unnamed protein product [Amoebophrya sp. A120]|eukprot:GSA120T00005027001.1
MFALSSTSRVYSLPSRLQLVLWVFGGNLGYSATSAFAVKQEDMTAATHLRGTSPGAAIHQDEADGSSRPGWDENKAGLKSSDQHDHSQSQDTGEVIINGPGEVTSTSFVDQGTAGSVYGYSGPKSEAEKEEKTAPASTASST